MPEATVLHLSDLQFGRHHRFSGRCLPDPEEARTSERYGDDACSMSLLTKLSEDLRVLDQKEGLRCNIAVVTGDLAEWSIWTEYTRVTDFLNGLCKCRDADLAPERVVLVPGNHDVNWDLSQSYFLECQADGKEPMPPYGRKFKHWDRFVAEFTGRPQDGVWAKHDFSASGVLVAGLNSSILESHRTSDHYGWLGTTQVREAVAWLREADPNHELVRIAALHHNVFRESWNDEENLKDLDDIYPIIKGEVDIILHGHRHLGHRAFLGYDPPILVFGAGSAGLDSESLPPCPNQYQVIRVEPHSCRVCLRRYSQKTLSLGSGEFGPDSSPEGEWSHQFPLRGGPMEASGSPRRVLDASVIEAYVDAARNQVATRLAREDVGTPINLECRDLRKAKIRDLSSVLDEWQDESAQQMVILGAGGTGKTISCLHEFQRMLQDPDRRLAIYVELGRYAGTSDIIEIVTESIRSSGIAMTRDDVILLLRTRPITVFLDGFDEYDRGDSATSGRLFEGFQYLIAENVKVLITCRSNFFRRSEDVFLYGRRSRDFELCPASAVAVEILPVDEKSIAEILRPYLKGPVPDWLKNVANRPLHLRMLVTLLRQRAIDLTKSITRCELYEHFVTHTLQWDLLRGQVQLTLGRSRDFHIALAERFLDPGVSALRDVEFYRLVQSCFDSDQLPGVLFFFQQSGLLRFDANSLLFVHKSIREYLVAKKIADLIAVDDDSFGFIWFTRNERQLIVEMLTERDASTLFKWLSNEDRYPACNYAAFILGATEEPDALAALRTRLGATEDPLVKINCLNALAALGDVDVRHQLMGVVTGYLEAEGLGDVTPPTNEEIRWIPALTSKFGREVMLIHLCEAIDALGMCGDQEAEVLLGHLQGRVLDKMVVAEAKAALKRLRPGPASRRRRVKKGLGRSRLRVRDGTVSSSDG